MFLASLFVACSFHHAVCVSADRPDRARDVLESADRAWDAITALGAPEPLADGSGTYSITLAAGPSHTDGADPRPFGTFDASSATTTIDARLAKGCTLDYIVAKEAFRAVAYRLAPRTSDSVAYADAAYLARLVTPCAQSQLDGIEVFQSFPERALADDWREPHGATPSELPSMPHGIDPRIAGDRFSSGASLFPQWLDESFGGEPGALPLATLALAATKRTSEGSEPDAFDVLRESTKGMLSRGSTLDDIVLSFSIDRMFAGERAYGDHFLGAFGFGAAANVRIDWSIDWPTKPRRLASPAGVMPTGGAYVIVDHKGAPPGSRLRIEAAWEELARMRWVAIKIDGAGHEKARVPIGTQDKSTSAQLTVTELDDVSAVAIVGSNVSAWSGGPFDPDDATWEPHGYLLTFAAE